MKVSPTQVHKKRNCTRLIAYEYVLQQRAPSSIKQQFGKNVHAQLETWLRNGVVPDTSPAGETAKQGIQNDLLPVPNFDLLVECRFEYPWHTGTNVNGFIDCLIPPNVADDGIPIVIDHKTTSNMRWAMTEDQLAKDPQGLIYAIYAMLRWGVRKAKSRWVYYSATNPKSGNRKPNGCKKIECEFDRNALEFRRNLSALCGDIDEIVRIRENKLLPADLPSCPGSCGNYGGCFFRGSCNLSKEEIITGYFDKF